MPLRTDILRTTPKACCNFLNLLASKPHPPKEGLLFAPPINAAGLQTLAGAFSSTQRALVKPRGLRRNPNTNTVAIRNHMAIHHGTIPSSPQMAPSLEYLMPQTLGATHFGCFGPLGVLDIDPSSWDGNEVAIPRPFCVNTKLQAFLRMYAHTMQKHACIY